MKKGILIFQMLVLLSGFGLTELAAATSDPAGSPNLPVAAAITVTPAPTPLLSAPQPGQPGIGDPYYPELGNGGYDVDHYDLTLSAL